MPVDELNDDELPRKWLDIKQYVAIDPDTGLPQLIRVEPIITETGEVVAERVRVYVDDDMEIMDRDAADALIDSLHCSPLEVTAQWKQNLNN